MEVKDGQYAEVKRTYIEAFEMWCYRRLLRVSWTEHKTNEWILEKIECGKGTPTTMKRRRLTYYGRVIRRTDCLEKDLTEGCTPGYRTRGRQRRRWREDISEWMGLHMNVAARSAEDLSLIHI